MSRRRERSAASHASSPQGRHRSRIGPPRQHVRLVVETVSPGSETTDRIVWSLRSRSSGVHDQGRGWALCADAVVDGNASADPKTDRKSQFKDPVR
ncbi:hypothetical protein GCM10023347_33050 [Streptomyces chumphonensis]